MAATRTLFLGTASAGVVAAFQRLLIYSTSTALLVAPITGMSASQGPIRQLGQSSPTIPRGEKSDTDYFLDTQTTRITATFADGTIALADHGGTGGAKATMTDRNGQQRGQLQVLSGLVQFQSENDPLIVANDSGERPTLYRSIQQARSLAKSDRRQLRWKGHVMQDTQDIDDPVAVETEWADGLVAKATWEPTKPPVAITTLTVSENRRSKRTLSGGAVVSRLFRYGAEVGSAAWYPQQQVWIWNLPTLNSHGLTDANQPGGWVFRPDIGWLNHQLIASFHFRSQLKDNPIAKAATPAPSNLADRWLQAFMPTLRANDVGCDILHWLDGTVYRPCCDIHDRCYEQASSRCAMRSWWYPFAYAWQCTACNIAVVYCFEFVTEQCTPWCYI